MDRSRELKDWGLSWRGERWERGCILLTVLNYFCYGMQVSICHGYIILTVRKREERETEVTRECLGIKTRRSSVIHRLQKLCPHPSPVGETDQPSKD